MIPPVVRSVQRDRDELYAVALCGGYQTSPAVLCEPGLDADCSVILLQKAVMIDQYPRSLASAKGNGGAVGGNNRMKTRIGETVGGKVSKIRGSGIMRGIIQSVRIGKMRVA